MSNPILMQEAPELEEFADQPGIWAFVGLIPLFVYQLLATGLAVGFANSLSGGNSASVTTLATNLGT